MKMTKTQNNNNSTGYWRIAEIVQELATRTLETKETIADTHEDIRDIEVILNALGKEAWEFSITISKGTTMLSVLGEYTYWDDPILFSIVNGNIDLLNSVDHTNNMMEIEKIYLIIETWLKHKVKPSIKEENL